MKIMEGVQAVEGELNAVVKEVGKFKFTNVVILIWPVCVCPKTIPGLDSR